MKFLFFFALVAVAAARPDYSKPEEAAILRDDRIFPNTDGAYSFDVETQDGIVRSESGYKNYEGSVNSQGTISFTHPDGSDFDLKFVANENGYQPESDALPVAPAFPHPIPQFVLDQIAFAANEDANKVLRAEDGYYVGYE